MIKMGAVGLTSLFCKLWFEIASTPSDLLCIFGSVTVLGIQQQYELTIHDVRRLQKSMEFPEFLCMCTSLSYLYFGNKLLIFCTVHKAK